MGYLNNLSFLSPSSDIKRCKSFVLAFWLTHTASSRWYCENIYPHLRISHTNSTRMREIKGWLWKVWVNTGTQVNVTLLIKLKQYQQRVSVLGYLRWSVGPHPNTKFKSCLLQSWTPFVCLWVRLPLQAGRIQITYTDSEGLITKAKYVSISFFSFTVSSDIHCYLKTFKLNLAGF